jgi:magnesium-protoporphyrin IX monomethyl ester (oxidative) cyclase
MSDAGVTSIQPGVEALATTTLKLMGKGTTAFHNLLLLKSALRHGVNLDWNLLIGFPSEPEEVYKKYMVDIPRLVHLPPPDATFPVRFDRYSPYHKHAQQYGLDLRPLDFYAMVYPFSEEELNQFAYFFSDHNYENQYIANLARWRRKIEASVGYWIVRWNGADGKPKAKLERGKSCLILDSRSGDAAEYELVPLAMEMLERLNEPMTLSRLVDQLGQDEREVARQMEILKGYDLIFQEGDRMLSLVC